MTAPYDAAEETTLSSLTHTHILTMGSPVVPLCSGWVASPCRLFPTSSPPSRFVFCQMFGLMMALMDGSHVSGSHLVIYLKTFQINRPQLSQSLSPRERGKSPLIRGLCNEAIFIARALKPTRVLEIMCNFFQIMKIYGM